MVGRRSFPIGMARIALGWTVKLPGSNFLLKETQSWCVQQRCLHTTPAETLPAKLPNHRLRVQLYLEGTNTNHGGFLLGWLGDWNESIPWIRKETLKIQSKTNILGEFLLKSTIQQILNGVSSLLKYTQLGRFGGGSCRWRHVKTCRYIHQSHGASGQSSKGNLRIYHKQIRSNQ